MADGRTPPYSPSQRKWNYILLIKSGGAFFGDTLWAVFKQMIGARIRRGVNWND
tara:strand:+ start:368 stop:529 length:162 start_codon:yes stop_codon:yes gene_type:complete